MRRFSRLHLTPLAAACALALIPAAAQAAVVQTVPLDSVANGIAVRNGQLYVVEPMAKKVEILSPTGEKRGEVALPGDAGAATSAAVGPDGFVWVAISSGADRGFVKINDDPAAIPISTAAAFDCGPVGMAVDPANQRMLYTAPRPSTGTPCGTHGMGAITAAGVNQVVDTTVPDAYALAVLNGKAFVPAFGNAVIQRLGIGSNALSLEASITAPPGSEPNGIAVRSVAHDIWVALYNSGEVVRLDPGAADGTSASYVTTGLSQPVGMAAHPDNSVWVASSGDGRLVRIGYAGSTSPVALPVGFQPWEVAAPDASGTSDGSVWVTDKASGQVARVLDVEPRVSVPADITGATVPVKVFTGGSATQLVVHVDGVKDIAGGTIPAAFGEQTVDVPLGSLPAGAHTVTADVINDRGMVATPSAGHFSVSAPSPLPPPAPRAPVKIVKPKKPTFADIVSVAAAKKCVSNRTLKLTLRKRKTGAKVTSVRVTAGHGKAKTYRGKALKSTVTLKALPKRGSYQIKVVVVLADKSKVALTRTYRACAVTKKH
ncbi:Virginiamycin B lyase [Baekduia alba]|nr:Virginiamycin B lyase [Baekduia alba]